MDERAIDAATHAHRQFASRRLALLATVVASALGAMLATWPLARDMSRATLASGEVLLTAWQLNWYHEALFTNPLAWVDANIFFPYDNAATFNDLLLTHALVALPAAWAGSPVLALNVALLAGIVLCGLFAHLLIEELSGAPWAAAIGGTLFALSPFRFLHLGHVSIAAAWAIPLFFWVLLRHLREPSWGRAATVAACGLAVSLSSLYHAAYVAPVLPLMLLFGSRRGPGGRATWLPLVVAGLSGLALLGWLLEPYVATLRAFGVASAPDDLIRYGADLSSLGQKPDFLGGGAAGINPEAHLYPGAAIVLLAALGTVFVVASTWTFRGFGRYIAAAVLGISGAAALGMLVPPTGAARDAWALCVLILIWLGPVGIAAWAVARTSASEAVGPGITTRIGIAGAALSFVLALGPGARYMSEAIGPAPYALLAQASSLFEGTRVPARFGGIAILFLALAAAGALAQIGAGRRRFAGVGMASLALVACFAELPIPELPEGRRLVGLANLQSPAYSWLDDQPGHFGILELPDWPSDAEVHYEHRSWRSLRYMLASKQHGQHLVNGTGRVEPFLWQRFRSIDVWSDDFFAFIASYFPVDYVLVHESGIPVESRPDLWAKLDSEGTGWRQVFRGSGTRVYTIDRSFGRGMVVDRLLLRRNVAPQATVAFRARVAPDAAVAGAGTQTATLDLLLDGTVMEAWEIDAGWREFRTTVPVDALAPDIYDARCVTAQAPCLGWPRAGALLRWRAGGESPGPFEINGVSIQAGHAPAD